jgi:Na+/proline symporter
VSWVLAGVLAYVVAQLAIGFAVSRRIANEADYLLGGRTLGPLLSTCTIFATWFGAETCIGSAGTIYAEGLTGSVAEPFGYAACLVLMALVFAAPLRRRRFTTLADLYRERYSPRTERLAVSLMVPTSLLWAAAQIRALGQVLVASSTLETTLAITIAAAVVVVYTVLGGFLADVWTDLIQGIVLALGLALLAFVVLEQVGGPAGAVASIDASRVAPFSGVGALDAFEDLAVPILGSVVAQELAARVLAARDERVARRSTFAAAGVYLAIGSIPVFLGLVGPSLVPGLEDGEAILPRLASLHLPTAGFALFAGALVSAILSTVNSALLVSASLVSHNWIVPARERVGPLDEAAKLRTVRTCVVLFGLLAYAIALQAESVYGLVKDASALGSSGLFVTLVFGLFSGFGGPRAAAASLLCGVATWVAGSYAGLFSHPFMVSLAAALAVYLAVAAFERVSAPSLLPAASGSPPDAAGARGVRATTRPPRDPSGA